MEKDLHSFKKERCPKHIASYLKQGKHSLREVYLLSGNYLENRGEMKITCEVSAVPRHISAKNA